MSQHRAVSRMLSASEEIDQRTDPERRLWAAVIIQAVRDMQWEDPRPDGPPGEVMTDGLRRLDWVRIRDEALVWLLYDADGFGRACDLAGVNPDRLRRKIRALLEGH
jgi:hypothetical protein